ncbi:MAG: universal stress protein [Nitrososphaeria archaeon]
MSRDLTWHPGRLLLPLSYTPYEMNAVKIAFYISECCGSPITIFHVRAPDEKEEIDFTIELEKLAKELKVKYELKEKTLRETFSHNLIASSIVDESNKEDYEYIVMPAHRERTYVEFFGRVSDRVVRKTKKKVVIVETPQIGLKLPLVLKRILAATFKETVSEDVILLSALLTSSASTSDAEIRVMKIVELPPTIPLDEVAESKEFKKAGRVFTRSVGEYIGLVGRPLTPLILPVREAEDVINYISDNDIDILLLSVSKPRFRNLLGKKEYGTVKKAPVVTLVVVPEA